MRYLLDVNALIALGHFDHSFHNRVSRWLGTERSPELLTCSITELGFVRILCHAPNYEFELSDVQGLLKQIKQTSSYSFQFVADEEEVSRLPRWVRTGKQTTDGHLVQLAKVHGAVLATLDGKIPGAFLIP